MTASANDPRKDTMRCPRCGAPMATSIDGMCAACLMRLAMPDSEPGAEAASDNGQTLAASPDARFAQWLELKGQRIGNYELLAEIARGGMGIVYRARQLGAERVIALKVMLPHLLHLPGMLERFRHEVEAAARLDHRAILPIYEVGEQAGLPYFSMKFAEGGALDKRQDSLAGQWRRIAELVAKVAHGVEHAHRRGILHRDLKPANVLFDAQDEPMVADFGLAKFRALDRALTLPASTLGSPNYMAPEQISAEFGEVGPATDVYGLGAVLYELLTGQPPIAGEDAIATMRLVPTQLPQSGVHARADLPADLDAIALKCLAKRPQDRYPSAEAVALDLERWIAGGEALAYREARNVRVRRWTGRALIGAGALVAAIAAWMVVGPLIATYEATTRDAASPLRAQRSIGVLPFANLGADVADDYLGAIVTDDLMRELRQIASLTVVPFRAREEGGKAPSPAELAERLGVDVVLDGDFARRDNLMHVRARLWDARSDQAIWQQAFDAPEGDVREMRSQIATALVTQLQIEVGDDIRAELTSDDSLTGSPEAYRHYLRARYLLRWRRPETLGEAARLLRAAIKLDPQFAQAHSALAYVYALWVPPTSPPEGEHWSLAVDFANRALALDPALGEPYAVLGNYHTIKGRRIEAEIAHRKSIELDPRDPAALHFYAIHLYSVGRLSTALEMERRSVANDAESPQPMMWLAMLTTALGDRNEARRLWDKSDTLGAARPLCAAVSRLDVGEPEYLAEWYRGNFETSGVPAAMRDEQLLATGVVDPAQRGPALAWLRKVEPSVDRAFAITHYALLGDPESALRIAENFDLDDDFFYLYQLCNIWSERTASVRSDPRFGTLMERWGFAEYWRRFGESEFCALTSDGVRCR